MEAQTALGDDGDDRAGIKCVVWDLDDTLWQGTLLEGDQIALTPGVRDVVVELDRRGILQSIASRNDFDAAWRQLNALGLHEYFLHPQIGWGSKSDSIRTIAGQLGIGLHAIALIDDQPFERDEVRHVLPPVRTLDASEIGGLLQLAALQPRFITKESTLRRRMYQVDLRRRQSEESFSGTKEEFLGTLGMCLTIRTAGEDDLRRAEELTVRTNQLNTSRRTYSYSELNALRRSSAHRLLVADLEDRYGSSGTIGVALLEREADAWTLRLLVVSCRVMSRGIGTVFLIHILQSARKHGVRLRAEFVPNDRNRIMYVTYKFNGFAEVREVNGVVLLEHDLQRIQPLPTYVTLRPPPDEWS